MTEVSKEKALLDQSTGLRKSCLETNFTIEPRPRLKDLAFCEVYHETETSPSGLCSVQFGMLLIQLEEYWIQFESKFGVKKMSLSSTASVTTLPSNFSFSSYQSTFLRVGL